MKQPFTYFLHRMRYRYFRRLGLPAVVAWSQARAN
jgi:hypothetical protein